MASAEPMHVYRAQASAQSPAQTMAGPDRETKTDAVQAEAEVRHNDPLYLAQPAARESGGWPSCTRWPPAATSASR